LGAILLGGASGTSARVLAAIRETGLEPGNFYRASHAAIYQAALALDERGESADAILLAAELERRGDLEEVGGAARLGELAATAAATSNAPHFARLVRARAVDLAVLRELEPLVQAARNGGLDPAHARAALERAVATLAEAQRTEADRRLVPGDEFVLDLPGEIPAVWGGASGTVAWARGEPLMLYGPDGVGKTTVGQQVALGRAGLRRRVLGMRVADDEDLVLYLALDRPAQAARSLARMVTEDDRERLCDRLLVWRGPLPFDVVKTPRALADFATAQGAGTVVIDSLKDIASRLSEDEVGGAVNSAIQELLARQVEVLALHHPRKRQQGGPPPKKLEDVYGSRWLVAGMGSVFCLWGEAGDPVVELLHLKQPSEPIPTCKLLHDHDQGITTILESVDLLQLVTATGDAGLTAEAAAAMLFATEAPDRNAIEKARRRLEKLIVGGFIVKRGGPPPNPVTYHPREAT
jgi:replicative DNA helicase